MPPNAQMLAFPPTTSHFSTEPWLRGFAFTGHLQVFCIERMSQARASVTGQTDNFEADDASSQLLQPVTIYYHMRTGCEPRQHKMRGILPAHSSAAGAALEQGGKGGRCAPSRTAPAQQRVHSTDTCAACLRGCAVLSASGQQGSFLYCNGGGRGASSSKAPIDSAHQLESALRHRTRFGQLPGPWRANGIWPCRRDIS